MEYSKRIILLSFGFVIAITIALHYLGWLSKLEQGLRSIFNYPSEFFYSISDAVKKGTNDSITTDEKELFLQCKNGRIISEAENIILKEENQELKKQLHYFASTAEQFVGAKVIGQDLVSAGRTLIINRGEKDGVRVGNPTIILDGILIGKIIKTFPDSAIIRLLSDSQSRVAATVLNNDHSIGLVEGGYDISIRMNSIPQNEIVQIGDVVITSGLEEGIPRGLVIGTLEAVVKEAYQPFQYAIIAPQAQFGKITLVSVLTSSKEE